MNESNTKLILLSMTQEILDSFIHNTAIIDNPLLTFSKKAIA